ncbi:MAG: hypothetical protein E7665_07425 [Ruminococcaceae bacterium]|nr:hypothetical protein [Oscillospiraceae bacterium]
MKGYNKMDNKVILISIDGMRSDGMQMCGNPYVKELERMCAYTYKASSMDPSVTFPCHFSMTHSVTPQRHGILTNTYVPQVRPVAGIFEKIKSAKGVSAMFYGWEPLRDIALPGTLKFSTYINAYMKESSDTVLTDEAIKVIGENKPDFAFLYMVETDEKGGHDNGWMSEEYLRRVSIALDNTKRMIDTFKSEYSVIIMADHGGHDRSHGTTLPEDMTIPLFFFGERFTPGEIKEELSLLDIAPTIAELMGIYPEDEWEGRSIV